MKLYAKCCQEYFDMLDYKTIEFRQIESIVLEGPSGEKREFLVKDIRKIEPVDQKVVMERYPKVLWDPEEPFFAIELGDEMGRNDLVVEHGVLTDSTKRWCAVGE